MKEAKTLTDFVQEFIDLKESYAGLFESSFKKDIALKNIEMIKNGRYAIVDEIWDIDTKWNFKYITSLLVLTGQFAEEYFDDMMKFSALHNDNNSFSEGLIIDVLTNKQKKISDFARQKEISNDFISFFLNLMAYPYRQAVARIIEKEHNIKDHISGFCPICGHWPGMSYLLEKEGRKFMACICCGTAWSFRRLKCSFCNSSEKDVLGYLSVEGEDEISAYTCDTCRRYLKIKTIDKDDIDFPEEMILGDYMASGHIDIAALQNKYLQEWIIGTRFNGPNDEKIDRYLKNS